MNCSPRSIVAISRDPRRAELLDALADARGYDVIYVESVESGYTRIKQVSPDLVTVFLEIDDVAGLPAAVDVDDRSQHLRQSRREVGDTMCHDRHGTME